MMSRKYVQQQIFPKIAGTERVNVFVRDAGK